MKYDIFISYRRENGEQSAKAIYDRLTERGYKVFMDLETLRSGDFNEKLYAVIDECRDMLVVLSPNALERCANEDDWLRLEVAHAIRCKKNVIPIMLRGFDFPPELPAEIESLRLQNGIQASAEFFDAFMKKLYQFLRSKPNFIRMFFAGLSWRRSLIATATCIFLIFGIWGAGILIDKMRPHAPKTYPYTQRQKNDVKNMLGYIFTNLGVADRMFLSDQDALSACEDYLRNPSESSYRDLVALLRHEREQLKKSSQQIMPLSKELSATMAGTKVDTAELAALTKYLNALYLECDQDITIMEENMNPARPLDNPTLFRMLDINRGVLNLNSKELIVSTCQLLLPVDEDALKEFRTKLLPELRVISKELPSWSRDKTSLNAQEKSIITQQNNLMADYWALVGEKNVEVMSEQKKLEDLKERSKIYPFTQKQKNDVKNMLDYVFVNLKATDLMLSSDQDALAACKDYLRSPSETSYRDLVSLLQHKRKELKKSSQQIIPLSKKLSEAMADTKINTAYLTAFYQYLNALYSECDQDIAVMEDAMNPAKSLDNPARNRTIDIGQNLLTLRSKVLIVGTCQLLLPVDEKALKEFHMQLLPKLKMISKELSLWSRDGTSLIAQGNKFSVQQNKLISEYMSLVGNDHLEITDPLADKKKELEAKKQQLVEAKKRLEEKNQELREKFTPKDSDGPYLVWGKALRFLRVGLYDDAVNAFQFYLNKIRATDPEAPVYVPVAINFVRSIDKTGIDYGVLVVGYEPGKPPHPQFKIGDIVVAINNNMCRNFSDYQKLVGALAPTEKFTATILRTNETTGQLRMIDVEIPRGGDVTKVALMDLKESE